MSAKRLFSFSPLLRGATTTSTPLVFRLDQLAAMTNEELKQQWLSAPTLRDTDPVASMRLRARERMEMNRMPNSHRIEPLFDSLLNADGAREEETEEDDSRSHRTDTMEMISPAEDSPRFQPPRILCRSRNRQ